jgi:hypothetical protein
VIAKLYDAVTWPRWLLSTLCRNILPPSSTILLPRFGETHRLHPLLYPCKWLPTFRKIHFLLSPYLFRWLLNFRRNILPSSSAALFHVVLVVSVKHSSSFYHTFACSDHSFVGTHCLHLLQYTFTWFLWFRRNMVPQFYNLVSYIVATVLHLLPWKWSIMFLRNVVTSSWRYNPQDKITFSFTLLFTLFRFLYLQPT